MCVYCFWCQNFGLFHLFPFFLTTMAAFGDFCSKSDWDKFQFCVPISKKLGKMKGLLILLKLTYNNRTIFCWYLKLGFVWNIFWTKIHKSSHSVLLEFIINLGINEPSKKKKKSCSWNWNRILNASNFFL